MQRGQRQKREREICLVDESSVLVKRPKYKVSKYLPDGLKAYPTPRKAALAAAKAFQRPCTDLREYEPSGRPPRNSVVAVYYHEPWYADNYEGGPGWFVGQVSGDRKEVCFLVHGSKPTTLNVKVRRCCLWEGDTSCEQQPRGYTWYVLYG